MGGPGSPWGAKCPGSGVWDTPGVSLEEWTWGRAGLLGHLWFIVSISPRTGVVGSANVLKCAFCLCTLVLRENSEPRRVVPSHDVRRKRVYSEKYVEPGLPTHGHDHSGLTPSGQAPRGSVGSTPFWAGPCGDWGRPRGRHEFSFLLSPTVPFIISACFRML